MAPAGTLRVEGLDPRASEPLRARYGLTIGARQPPGDPIRGSCDGTIGARYGRPRGCSRRGTAGAYRGGSVRWGGGSARGSDPGSRASFSKKCTLFVIFAHSSLTEHRTSVTIRWRTRTRAPHSFAPHLPSPAPSGSSRPTSKRIAQPVRDAARHTGVTMKN